MSIDRLSPVENLDWKDWAWFAGSIVAGAVIGLGMWWCAALVWAGLGL